jgi:hypothetical protein
MKIVFTINENARAFIAPPWDSWEGIQQAFFVLMGGADGAIGYG